MRTTDEPSNPGPRALLPWLFPLALWALATLALGGDLGRYFDDYATTMRDPVTGEVNLRAPFEHFPFFWRPLHWLYVYHSLTWFHDCLRIPHLLDPLSHGLASILLYTLLRRRIRSPHAAAVRVRVEWAFKPALAAAVALAACYGAAGLLGFHKSFQQQAHADVAQAARLRELVPDPPRGAVFVPMHVAAPGAALRPGMVGWLWVEHAARPLLCETYRRDDLRTTFFNPWMPVPLADPDAEGFTFVPRASAPERFGWELAVPFGVDSLERVHLVRELVIEDADGAMTTVRPPLVDLAVRRGADDAVAWSIKAPP